MSDVGEKEGRFVSYFSKGSGEWKSEGSLSSNRLSHAPSLLLIIEAKREVCSEGSLHNHVPKRAWFLWKMPPIPTPLFSFVRETISHLWDEFRNPNFLPRGIVFVSLQFHALSFQDLEYGERIDGTVGQGWFDISYTTSEI